MGADVPLPREMEAIEVGISAGGKVRIAQTDAYQQNIIVVAVEQVDALCDWLQGTKVELLGLADQFPEEEENDAPMS